MLGLADRRNQRIIAESRQHVFVILNERFHCGTHLVVDRRIRGNHHTGAECLGKRRNIRHALPQKIHASDASVCAMRNQLILIARFRVSLFLIA